ncbi:hypothetical protein BHM03_00017164 [Ensete ventricosum]|nr:hypothetical protein BHM03_00017164 [Ensete ventricosum]
MIFAACRCVICCMAYKNRDKLIKLSCQHQYHKVCITKWLKINKVYFFVTTKFMILILPILPVSVLVYVLSITSSGVLRTSCLLPGLSFELKLKYWN